jgi:hypothetical protein
MSHQFKDLVNNLHEDLENGLVETMENEYIHTLKKLYDVGDIEGFISLSFEVGLILKYSLMVLRLVYRVGIPFFY